MTKKSNKRAITGRERWVAPAWMLVLLLATAAVIFGMWPALQGEGYTGGTLRGIVFGALALAAITISMLYSLRKDQVRFSVLPLNQWLYSHVVLGTLSLVLVMAHSGLQFQNLVAVLALGFLTLTVLSGVAGMFLFYYLPRIQIRDHAVVLIPDDICKRLTRLHQEISELCSEQGGVFLEVYNELVIPLYRTQVGKHGAPPDVNPWAEKLFGDELDRFLILAVKIELAHDLMVLLGRNMWFRWWIRGWLVLHIPVTIGLLVFTAVHLVSITWYGVK